jgi:hypothetical protein
MITQHIEQLVLWQSASRKAAEHERARTEAEILGSLLAFGAHQLDAFALTHLLFRDQQVTVQLLYNIARRL